MRLYDIVLLVPNPLEKNHSFFSLGISDVPLSECTHDLIPKIENKLLRHLLTGANIISSTGKTNLEYSSMTVNMYSYLEDGMSPLKSIDSLSND